MTAIPDTSFQTLSETKGTGDESKTVPPTNNQLQNENQPQTSNETNSNKENPESNSPEEVHDDEEELLSKEWKHHLVEISPDPTLTESCLWRLVTCRAFNCQKLWSRCLCHLCRKEASQPLKIYLPIKSTNALIVQDSPFAFLTVSDEVIEFLIQKAWDELLYKQKPHIVVQSLDSSVKQDKDLIEVALRNSFYYTARMTNYERIRTTAEGCSSCRISICVILLVLAVLIPIVSVGAQAYAWVQLLIGIGIIVIWVAIWHPIEMLLYGTIALLSRRNLCVTLGEAIVSVEIVDSSALTMSRRILVQDDDHIV